MQSWKFSLGYRTETVVTGGTSNCIFSESTVEVGRRKCPNAASEMALSPNLPSHKQRVGVVGNGRWTFRRVTVVDVAEEDVEAEEAHLVPNDDRMMKHRGPRHPTAVPRVTGAGPGASEAPTVIPD